jgi:hypothetical protein
MEEENEVLKYKAVTYTFLIFFLLYFIIHVGLSFYPANQSTDPINKEGFWFYVRVFAPMIGAAIGAFASFKAAIYTFNQTKEKEDKREIQKKVEFKKMLLQSVTNLGGHIYLQLEILEALIVDATNAHTNSAIIPIVEGTVTFKSDVLLRINPIHIHKALFLFKENISTEDNSRYYAFNQNIFDLEKTYLILEKLFENHNKKFDYFNEIQNIYRSNSFICSRNLNYPESERFRLRIFLNSFNNNNFNFREFLNSFGLFNSMLSNTVLRNELNIIIQNTNLEFQKFLSNYLTVVDSSNAMIPVLLRILNNIYYVVRNFYSEEENNLFIYEMLQTYGCDLNLLFPEIQTNFENRRNIR